MMIQELIITGIVVVILLCGFGLGLIKH